jgi:hypothetical protein
MEKAIQEFLANGGKIEVLPPSRVKKSLGFPIQGHKYSEYNVGKKKVDARLYASKKAA